MAGVVTYGKQWTINTLSNAAEAQLRFEPECRNIKSK